MYTAIIIIIIMKFESLKATAAHDGYPDQGKCTLLFMSGGPIIQSDKVPDFCTAKSIRLF